MLDLGLRVDRAVPEPLRDRQVARDLFNHLQAICAGENWRIEIDPGTQSWDRTMVAEGFWRNPCFVPEKSDVHEQNSLTVTVREADGKFVAINALRFWQTDSFNEIISSGELFYGRNCPLIRPLPLILPEEYPDLNGMIGYSGGTVIGSGRRGQRLGLLTTRLVRCLAEISVQADHHVGHFFHTRPGELPPKQPYHFARCTKCLSHLPIPDRPEPHPLWMLDMTREEFLAQARRDLSKLADEGHEDVRDLALLTP